MAFTRQYETIEPTRATIDTQEVARLIRPGSAQEVEWELEKL